MAEDISMLAETAATGFAAEGEPSVVEERHGDLTFRAASVETDRASYPARDLLLVAELMVERALEVYDEATRHRPGELVDPLDHLVLVEVLAKCPLCGGIGPILQVSYAGAATSRELQSLAVLERVLGAVLSVERAVHGLAADFTVVWRNLDQHAVLYRSESELH